MSVLQLEHQNDTSIKGNFSRNKAVSDGAISFYLDHFVTTRVSKVTYGIFVDIHYDPNDPDHRSRSHNVFTCNSGIEVIPDFFYIVLPKVSFLIPFTKSELLKKAFICRIPKFRRWRNSENLMVPSQILYFLSDLLIRPFGVTVEISWLQSGKTLILVRVISELFA